MKNNTKNQEYPVWTFREDLRQQANDRANRLSRSVARLTSRERLPCLEYGEEVSFEKDLAEDLFYLQYCRDALERCIDAGSAVLRYRRRDGTVSTTRFRMVGPGRVRVSGLLGKTA